MLPQNRRKGNDLAVFYHRFSGKPILTPCYHHPNPAAFGAFVAELTVNVRRAPRHRVRRVTCVGRP